MKGGDGVEDLDQVYRVYSQIVYRFLLAKCGSPQQAEELTQETFYQAVRSIHRFDGSCRMTTWLCGIARNVLLASCRKNRAQPVPLEQGEQLTVPSAEEDALSHMGRETILDALERLAEPGREVVRLRVIGGLSYAQIGEIMGRTENWARVTYYRAKMNWRKELQDETHPDL